MMTGFLIGVLSSLALLLFGVVIIRLTRRDRTKDVVEKMERTTKRLQQALAELMSRADEIDQESKFIGESMSPSLSQRLSKVCSDLVVLGDAVKVIETRIEKLELDHAKKDLLISLGAASKISSEINEVRDESTLR